jgi:hypothetical protein
MMALKTRPVAFVMLNLTACGFAEAIAACIQKPRICPLKAFDVIGVLGSNPPNFQKFLKSIV